MKHNGFWNHVSIKKAWLERYVLKINLKKIKKALAFGIVKPLLR